MSSHRVHTTDVRAQLQFGTTNAGGAAAAGRLGCCMAEYHMGLLYIQSRTARSFRRGPRAVLLRLRPARYYITGSAPRRTQPSSAACSPREPARPGRSSAMQ